MQLWNSDDHLLAQFRKHDRHVLLVKGNLIDLPIAILIDLHSPFYLHLETADVAVHYLSQGAADRRLLVCGLVTGHLSKSSFRFD
jgi:hypothetical protein